MRQVWRTLALSLGCFLLVLTCGAAAVELPACKTDLATELDKLELPGLAAAIVKNGQIVCASASGFANIAEDRPVTPDTLFLVASISKTVTATALMQLYEQGKFKLDDDINDYLAFDVRIPDAPDAPITFRQLLTHTSSIQDSSFFNDFLTKGMDSPITLAELLQGYLTPDGAYYDANDNFQSEAPGEVYEYTNMNFVLIGYLVEVMSGVPFDKYCRDNIFAPLGMEKRYMAVGGGGQIGPRHALPQVVLPLRALRAVRPGELSGRDVAHVGGRTVAFPHRLHAGRFI